MADPKDEAKYNDKKKRIDDEETDDELENAFFDPFDKSGHLQELFKDAEKSQRETIETMKKQVSTKEENKQKAKKEQNKKRYMKNSEVIKKGGNFQMQVHIIKAMELKSHDLNGANDPRVSVTIFNEKKTTKKIDKTISPFWDQILYFDFDLQPNELTKGKCLLQILDADMITADDLIGYFVFDLSWIYYKQHHRVYKQWVAVTNDEPYDESDEKQGNDEIYGKLQCSITVLGPNDEQYLYEDDIDTSQQSSGLVLMPPTIIQTPYLLTVNIYSMVNLINTDQGSMMEYARHRIKDLFKKDKSGVALSDMDPFLYVEYAGTRIGSSKIYKVVEQYRFCQVQTRFEIPVMEPTFSQDITVTVMEWDLMTRNDRIGSVRIDYKQLKDDENKIENAAMDKWHIPKRWYYMYGAPPGEQRGYARKMNKGLVEGSHFRGQIYLDVTLEKTKHRKSCRVTDLEKAISGASVTEEKREEWSDARSAEMSGQIYDDNMDEYYLRCDLYEGTEINDIGGISSSEVSVEVHIGNCIAKSKEKKIKNDNAFIVWNEALIHDDEDHPASDTHTKHKNTKNLIGPFRIHKNWQTDVSIPLPNVYIYLCIAGVFSDDRDPVSYCCVPLRNILPNTHGIDYIWCRPPEWLDMTPNLALDQYKDNVFPGSLLVALNAGRLNTYIGHDTAPKKDKSIPIPIPIPKQINPSKPKQVRPQLATVTVIIIGATDLPKLDKDGVGCDPYVKIIIEGQEPQQTNTIKNTMSPNFLREYKVFHNVELNKARMKLEVYDWDRFGKDDFAGDTNYIALDGQKINDKTFKLFISKNAKNEHKENKSKHSTIKIAVVYTQIRDVDKSAKQPEKNETEEKSGGFFKGLSEIFSQPSEVIMYDKGLEKQAMELRVHAYLAKNLQNMDLSGLSDAYLMVRFCGREAKTQIIDNHIDPKWYETLVIEDVMVPYDETADAPWQKTPNIICEIYDFDLIGKDESLGRFKMDPSSVFVKDSEKYEKPTLYSKGLDDARHDPVDGEVLVAFELFKADNSANIPLPDTLKPNVTSKWMHIITLGLRDLQSTFGLIHKPFIEFEINGMMYKTQASNVPESRNPNFNQILTFPVELPDAKEDKMFLPNVNLTVKDSICGGAIKRTIGYASQDIENYMDNKNIRMHLNNYKHNYNEEDKEEEEPHEFEEYKQEEQASYVMATAGDKASRIGSVNAKNKAQKSKKIKNKSGLTAALLQDDADAGFGSTDVKEEEQNNKQQAGPQKKKSNTWEYAPYKPQEVPLQYMQGRETYENKPKEKRLDKWENEIKPIFNQIELCKGISNSGYGEKRTKSGVGFFKGLIAVTDTRNTGNVLINKFLKNFGKTTDLFLRLYVLKGIKLAPRDSNDLSDPYLIIKIGDTKITTRDRYKHETLSPDFYESFEIAVSLPGPSKLQIQVWDHDAINDDIIGKTEIDIEDRYYAPNWRHIPKKPIEQRVLRLDESARDCGKLQLWMELLTVQQQKKQPMVDIKLDPIRLYELRVIIWECQGVPNQDDMTNASDLYVTGELVSPHNEEEQQTQSTDVHRRTRNGKGSFNWRMKFPIHLPKRNGETYPQLKLQIWDNDILDPDDFVVERTFDGLEHFLKYCEINSKDSRCQMTVGTDPKTKHKMHKIWIPGPPKGLDSLRSYLDMPISAGGKKGKENAKILMSIELVPEKDIHRYPAGLGRGEPNMNPVLPDPVGRSKFSLFHPWDTLRTILGDRCIAKFCCLFCCIIIIAFIILIIPNLFSAIVANLFV